MTAASWELQKAIFASLAANANLATVLGGARIYDRVPRPVAYPYVTFGPVTARDWSTATEEGSEILVTLEVWSQTAGVRETHLVIDALRDALRTATLTLPGHRLINLRFEAADIIRADDGETIRGTLRLRAVTEPAA